MTLLQVFGVNLLADGDTNSGFFPPTFWPGLCATLIYGVVGIGLVVLGFKVFDWLTPQIHVQKELAEKHNIAVAILVAAVILGICYVVGQVAH